MLISPLRPEDLDGVQASFTQEEDGYRLSKIWDVYLKEQQENKRLVFLCRQATETTADTPQYLGFASLKWRSDYPPFARAEIPTIYDLNVLRAYRKQGIATQLLNAMEKAAKAQGFSHIGIGVGVLGFYGPAQRLYIKQGYVPDGQGLMHDNVPVAHSQKFTPNDDTVLWLYKEL